MSVSVGDITFINAILCEDVRQEINNKFILIGVFAEDILISEIPGQLQLAFYVELRADNAGEHILSFRMSGPGEGTAIMKARMNVAAPGKTAALNTPQITVAVTAPGVFRVDASLDEIEWVNLISKTISLADPSVLQPPFVQSPPDAQEPSSQP